MRTFPAAALLVLAGPVWFTFYEAYQDGLDAQRQGDPARAALAFRRAIELEPTPGQQVKTYGLNFLPAYHPYLRLAEACLALGDATGAERALARSDRFGVEPAAEREALRKRLAKQAVPTPPAPALPPPARPAPSQAAPAPSPLPAARPVQEVRAPDPEPAEPRPKAPPAARVPAPARPLAPAGNPVTKAPSPSPAAPRRKPWPWLLGSLAGVCALAAAAWRLKGGTPPPGSPGADPNLNREFGPYHPVRYLGEGGCATAYQGLHRNSGQPVAIKVPHPHLLKDPDFRARFQREASLGARLHHPRIVRILTPSPEDDDLWLAMAFVEGLTLEARLKEGPLPIPEAIGLGRQIAEAIAHAHEQSVVHRDLKPGNIMLTREGAVVLDFGIARVLDATRTTSTMFMGTPAYAAPESLQNPQVGPPADRYALGLILFEMLTGHHPFEGLTAFQVLEAHRTLPLPGITVPGVPATVVRLVERLCSKDPVERPEDGETLACLKGASPS